MEAPAEARPGLWRYRPDLGLDYSRGLATDTGRPDRRKGLRRD